MSRLNKILIICVSLLGLGYLIYFLTVLSYSHSVDWELDKEYVWLINDSIRKEINTDYGYSCVEERDVYTNLHYKNYNIAIWEFKDLSNIALEDVRFNNVNDLASKNLEFDAGQIINKGSDMEITIKFAFSLSKSLSIKTDTVSEIIDSTKGDNYKAIYGNFNRFTLNNEKNEPQIIFNYTDGKTPTVILALKNKRGFYLITINSKNIPNINCIKLINLAFDTSK